MKHLRLWAYVTSVGLLAAAVGCLSGEVGAGLLVAFAGVLPLTFGWGAGRG